MVPSVEVDGYQQLCEEDRQLEDGGENESLEVVNILWLPSGWEREMGVEERLYTSESTMA